MAYTSITPDPMLPAVGPSEGVAWQPTHSTNSSREIIRPPGLEDLLPRFQDIRRLSIHVMDWYTRAWKDAAEELSVLVDSPSKSPTKAASEPLNPDLSQDSLIKGSVFEGLFATMRRSVMAAETQINHVCFKRRGKYTEAECKQGVATALERMGNEIWKQVSVYVQKPVGTRVSDSLKSLNNLQAEAEKLKGKMREAMIQYEERLKRLAITQTLGSPQGSEHEDSKEEIAQASFDSSQQSAKISPNRKNEGISQELNEQGSRLFRNFQSIAKVPNVGALPIRKEMDEVLKDMVQTLKTSKVQKSPVTADSSEVEKHIARIRYRVDALCRNMAEVSSNPNSGDTARQEIQGLKALIATQAAEIDRLQKVALEASTASPSIDPSAIKQDIDRFGKSQDNMLLEIRELRVQMEKVFLSTKEKPGSLTQALKILKTSAAHIRAGNDLEFVQQFIEEYTSQRQATAALLETVRNEGFEVEGLDNVSSHFLKMRQEALNLREEYNELTLKLIQVQSQVEIEAEFNATRTAALEAEIEALKATKTEESEPAQVPSNELSIEKALSLEEENKALSEDNFVFMEKLEAAGEEITKLVAKTQELETALKQAEIDLSAIRETFGPDLNPLFLLKLSGSENLESLVLQQSHDSGPGKQLLTQLQAAEKRAEDKARKEIELMRSLETFRNQSNASEVSRLTAELTRVQESHEKELTECKRLEIQIKSLLLPVKTGASTGGKTAENAGQDSAKKANSAGQS